MSLAFGVAVVSRSLIAKNVGKIYVSEIPAVAPSTLIKGERPGIRFESTNDTCQK